ncbi:1,2-phenylacetyl-CoA epoxidase subunit PaaD [Thioalkalivibrio sp. HK1]|uniref:1,2-phenylacetyl-CoA epoxidase subunit PaaD n=1 Tax=Thioalkalivibrio sp. HK1 TaxID=1469245 RepID=UPI000472DCB9|nr:1,2-phenylacetyl-CoA epoxidase subunit PaaD [Thioalkalivibrio sp. HK1]
MKPDPDRIRHWLEEVPDPEIPAISVIDLGVVRKIEWRGDRLEIAITPTYSGCPANRAIVRDIEDCLRSHGLQKIRFRTSLFPPWTSDWLSDKARIKLAESGIAPPAEHPSSRSGRPQRCPQCGDERLTRISEFGSTPCKSLWRCERCHEPFDYFKCI